MKIKLPLITDNLRLYYSDYKNYYYLPYEDTAIHKSVAAYVDAECKVKATRETAYTKNSLRLSNCLVTIQTVSRLLNIYSDMSIMMLIYTFYMIKKNCLKT